MTQTVSLTFFRLPRLRDRIWALGMMGAARLWLPRVPGIRFWKLCGSGVGEGFTPTALPRTIAILATWDDEKTARHQTETAAIYNRYRARAAEDWTIYLAPTSARGEWAGVQPFEPEPDEAPGTDRAIGTGGIAALTRATVRPSKALQFWRQVPNISEVIGADPNVAFKIGIGEVPLLHQVTFSIWPGSVPMAEFARKDGPHAKAIRAVRDGNWFREELYARFAILGDFGTWGGISPLRNPRRPL